MQTRQEGKKKAQLMTGEDKNKMIRGFKSCQFYNFPSTKTSKNQFSW